MKFIYFHHVVINDNALHYDNLLKANDNTLYCFRSRPLLNILEWEIYFTLKYKCGHRNVLSKRQVWMSIFHII